MITKSVLVIMLLLWAFVVLIAGCSTVYTEQEKNHILGLDKPEQCETKRYVSYELPMWNERDDQEMELAKKGCIKNYGLDSCLVKFTKIADNSYYAVCRRLRRVESK